MSTEKPVCSVNCFTIVPRHEFARLVNTHQGERHCQEKVQTGKWAQFTAMLFCQTWDWIPRTRSG